MRDAGRELAPLEQSEGYPGKKERGAEPDAQQRFELLVDPVPAKERQHNDNRHREEHQQRPGQ